MLFKYARYENRISTFGKGFARESLAETQSSVSDSLSLSKRAAEKPGKFQWTNYKLVYRNQCKTLFYFCLMSSSSSRSSLEWKQKQGNAMQVKQCWPIKMNFITYEWTALIPLRARLHIITWAGVRLVTAASFEINRISLLRTNHKSLYSLWTFPSNDRWWFFAAEGRAGAWTVQWAVTL